MLKKVLLAFAVILGGLSFIFSLFIESFEVPTNAMAPALDIGDHFFSNRLKQEPQRGDIIVFQHPVEQSTYVKRVIGLPGDEITLLPHSILINGQAEDTSQYKPIHDTEQSHGRLSPNLNGLSCSETSSACAIQPGYYFVLGDNRDNSADSRYFGGVPTENIKGTAFLIYWSDNTEKRGRSL